MVDDPDVARSRDTLRTSVQRMRGTANPAAIARASQRAADVLGSLSGLNRARTVLVHRPVSGDLDPTTLVQRLAERGVRVLSIDAEHGQDSDVDGPAASHEPVVPSVLVPGRSHLAHAGEDHVDDLALVEVVVVPGVAFDLDGGRLGPHDDPWPDVLRRIDAGALRIGLARSAQLVPRVPHDPDDPDPVVDVVVTDRAAHHTGARLDPRDA